MLADHGAQVILVSNPKPNPEMFRPAETDPMHRGKRSIVLDLKKDPHKLVLEKLVKTSDVILDSFRPTTLSKLGFHIERLVELNPRIIIAKMSAYGMNGKLAHHAGHDLNFAALSGVVDTFTAQDSILPVIPPLFVGDMSAINMCFSSILLSVINKQKGFEQYQVRFMLPKLIDISYAESAMYYSILSMTAKDIGILGNRENKGMLNGRFANYNYYKSKDGTWYALGTLEHRLFVKALEVLGVDQTKFQELEEERKIDALQDRFSSFSDGQLNRMVWKYDFR